MSLNACHHPKCINFFSLDSSLTKVFETISSYVKPDVSQLIAPSLRKHWQRFAPTHDMWFLSFQAQLSRTEAAATLVGLIAKDEKFHRYCHLLPLMAINPHLTHPQHPSRWGRCNPSRRSQIGWWMGESGRSLYAEPGHGGGWYLCFSKHSQLCPGDYYGANINGLWASCITSAAMMVAEGVLTRCEGDILWRPRDPYRTTTTKKGSIKVAKLQPVRLISPLSRANANGCGAVAVRAVSKSYEMRKIYVWPPSGSHAEFPILGELQQMFYVVVWYLIVLCCVLTEEPWQRQFSVTCRETDIKILLILFLIIPTRNIWIKAAM